MCALCTFFYCYVTFFKLLSCIQFVCLRIKNILKNDDDDDDDNDDDDDDDDDDVGDDEDDD